MLIFLCAFFIPHLESLIPLSGAKVRDFYFFKSIVKIFASLRSQSLLAFSSTTKSFRSANSSEKICFCNLPLLLKIRIPRVGKTGFRETKMLETEGV